MVAICILLKPSSRYNSVDVPGQLSQARKTSNTTSSLTRLRVPLDDLNVFSRFLRIALSISHLEIVYISNMSDGRNFKRCGTSMIYVVSGPKIHLYQKTPWRILGIVLLRR